MRALLDVADDAAYQAKRNGKNQVVVAPLPSE
jgi:PleD family two-component response regulator